MHIRMWFVKDAERLSDAPRCAWVQASIALDLMQLGRREQGACTLSMLKVGLARATSILTDPRQPWPAFVRSEAERRSLVVYLALIAQARERARAEGATGFQWREDF